MYARIFDWLIARINQALVTNQKVSASIGVLDIYGFEVFQVHTSSYSCHVLLTTMPVLFLSTLYRKTASNNSASIMSMKSCNRSSSSSLSS